MENGLFITQLAGVGLILYAGITLLQSWLTEPNPWDVTARASAERQERRMRWAVYAREPVEPYDSPPLRISPMMWDRGADALANCWLAEILEPVEMKLAA
jgi:hypothetical protein